MSTPEAREEVRAMLDGLSDLEVRAMCIRALRAARDSAQIVESAQFQMHGHLGRSVVPLLAERRGDQLRRPVNELGEVFKDDLQQPCMGAVFEFTAWLVRAGLALPFGAVDPPNGNHPTFRLTRAGVRFLRLDDDHPLVPGYVERLATRCHGIGDGVVSLLVQSSICLDHGLMQPAIVMMGVAYETAVEGVAEALIARNVLAANVLDFSAARRIDAVRNQIERLFPRNAPEPERRGLHFAVVAAYEFADQLRRRRNDASHTAPTYGFEDREEVEEFLVSAGRNLPNLWRPALP